MPVHWLIEPAASLRAAAHGLQMQGKDGVDVASGIQEQFNATLAETFPGQVVIVRERLSGYRPFDGLGILLVEVQPAAGPPTPKLPFASPGVYIVKVAMPNRLGDLRRELEAWELCRPSHIRGDGILISLDPFPPRGEGDPRALVYGDATTALGTRSVTSLEDAFFQSCRFGQPALTSLTVLMGTLYDRLEGHFFARSARVSPESYLAEDSRPPLKRYLEEWREPASDHAAASGRDGRKHLADFRCVRRETLAILGSHHAAYADPVDVLTGLCEDPEGRGRLPDVRRGFSHGDLHARNVEVEIRGDHAVHCAVFDYEKMRPNNFIGWDFIKLEIELSVRFLEARAAGRWCDFVLECLAFWKLVAALTDEFDRHNDIGLDAALRVIDKAPRGSDEETLLPQDPQLGQAVARLPAELQRLAVGIVEIRRLAKKHLRGPVDWVREYDFLLAWYGMRAALYENYEDKMVAAALIGAGVSARRLITSETPTPSPERSVGETTHRPRFVEARRLARSGTAEGLMDGIGRLVALRRDYPHVLEIEEELALAYIEAKEFPNAEGILHSIKGRYRNTTAETPSRLGSLWKRRAVAVSPYDRPALRIAKIEYQRASAISNDYFPQINLATISWLLEDRDTSRETARRVLQILEAADPDEGDDSFWSHATRGEALLLLAELPERDLRRVCDSYRKAVAHPSCTPRDRASMRRQLVFLRPHLDPDLQEGLSDAILDSLFGSNDNPA